MSPQVRCRCQELTGTSFEGHPHAPHVQHTDQVAGGGFLFVLYHRLDLLFGCNGREAIASESVVRLRGTLYTESESYLSESVPSTPPAKPT